MPSADKYTDPKLRDQVKKEVQESDKGGAPGQWSARKAQFMASEYKKRGGGYTDDGNKDESQKNLSKWGDEQWQTKDGSGEGKQEDGSRKRYLPKKAWENMSEEEKKKTDDQKQKQSKQGKQFVANTGKAKQERKKAKSQTTGKQANGKQQNGTKNKSHPVDCYCPCHDTIHDVLVSSYPHTEAFFS
ncbi:hypothetical protein [Sporisorium scitamineum]|uniref:DUF5872 domain-containing protein n=1 Tax=Sporisorium scitamineum TaxID=49012 RepID=A0A0F7S0W4_9BASI|nr:hypothetical protein [Sporisorium scitamineum]